MRQRLLRTVWTSALAAALAWAPGSAQTTGGEAGVSPQAAAQIGALLKAKSEWTPAQRKMASALHVEIGKRSGGGVFLAAPELRSGLEVAEDGSVLVDIEGRVTPGLLAEIEARGGKVVAAVPRFGSVRARLPLDEVENLAAAEEVRRIRPAGFAITNKTNTSEGDVAHAAVTARSAFGVTGTGVKVGVLSDGVGSLAAVQASGDLPGTVTVLPGQAGDPSDTEGTAMLEIVYDLAPQADLYFATAFTSMAQFAQNILDLEAAGCDAIVDDVFWVEEPVFQDGIIALAAEEVTARGSVYFSSAGNSGNLNDETAGVWEGDFVSSGGVPAAITAFDADYATSVAHDFGSGDTLNRITADGFYFTLHWSDPLARPDPGTAVPGGCAADPLCGSDNDYDLFLLNSAGTAVEGVSFDVQNGDDNPYEELSSQGFNDFNKNLVIVKFDPGDDDRYLHLNTIRGELEHATVGQTAGHAAARHAFGVAAVDEDESGGAAFAGDDPEDPSCTFGSPTCTPVEDFSSDGPRRVFFDTAPGPDGDLANVTDNVITAITPGDFSSSGGEVLQKPDVTATDCVQTATPGFGVFCGTSAAAPHVAAIAALMLENGNLTADGMRAVFAAKAFDIEATGADRDAGNGIVMADRALAVTEPTSPTTLAVTLNLFGDPNDGPQTFRAQTIVWGAGEYNDVTGRAETHIFTDGFESGDVSAWSNSVP